MATIQKTKFGKVQIPVAAGITLDDVVILVTTDSNQADLDLGAVSYVTKIEGNTLTISPNVTWLEGITITVSIAGALYKDSFRVPRNLYIYDPEQLLYSQGILDTVTDTQLVTLNLGTEDEVELLSTMGPKLTQVWDKMCKLLCASFTYDNSSENKKVTRLVGFRRMQQIALSLRLDSLVESILLSPGPLREWFREATIEGAKTDKTVLEDLPSISKDIASLRNTMVQYKLNTEMISAIDYQLDPGSDYHTLASYILTLFSAIRYTHDNPKFSY